MRTQTPDNIQLGLWNMANVTRGEFDAYQGALLTTELFTIKLLSDNAGFFHLAGLLSWTDLSSPGGDVTSRLRESVSRIESADPSLAGVLRRDWKVDTKTLYRLIHELDLLDLSYPSMEDPEPLNGTIARAADAWFDRILRNMGKFGGPGASTPVEVSQLCARLLQVDSGRVYDGTAGYGGMLIELAREAKHNTGLVPRLYGQEIHQETWAMCKMNLILHGLTEAEIACGDTLEEPAFRENDSTLTRFDGIVMQPPFALKLRDKEAFQDDAFGRFRYGVPSAAHADMAFVLHSIASLKNTGKAVLVEPHGVLFRGGIDESIRKVLLEDGLIESVIFLPRNLLSGTGLAVAVLVLNRNNPHPGHVLFVRADEDFLPGRLQNVLRAEDIDRICSAYTEARDIDSYSRLVAVDEIARNEWNLNVRKYIDQAIVDSSKIGKVQVSMRSFIDSSGPKVRLADIATGINRGFDPPKDGDVAGQFTHRLVNLSDVDDEGVIHIETTTPLSGDARKLRFHELDAGDVILASRGTALKAAVVPASQEKLVASSNFNIIRVRDQYDPWFIKTFLESPVGLQLLEANQRGSAVPVISHKDLVDILIPDIPLDIQREIGQASRTAEDHYREAVEDAKREYQAGYRRIYDSMGLGNALQSVNGDR